MASKVYFADFNCKSENIPEKFRRLLITAGIKTVSIEYLRDLAYSMTGVPKEIETTDKVTCIVEYRDGTVIDVIRQIKKD